MEKEQANRKKIIERKYQLKSQLVVGAKVKIGYECGEKIGRKDLSGRVVKLVEGWFEQDNGLYVSDTSCPSLWNRIEEDWDSIYHLFGNNLEDFCDSEVVFIPEPKNL